MGCGSILQTGISVFFEYDTPRIVHIRSKKVGVINRLIQLIIIGYVIGYAIVYKKGYQEFDDVVSAVTTKVKGVVFVNQTEHPDITTSVWDVAEYVVPPQENNAFFVATNLIETPRQSIQICPEDPDILGANCTADADCHAGETLPVGNGVMTGKCDMTGTKRCLIHAWCPVENGKLKAPLNPVLLGSRDFTVFIKNNIEFPKFNVKRRNLPDNATDVFFQTCKYSNNKDCPIFRLETIVNGAGVQSYQDIATNVRRRNILGFHNNSELSNCRYTPDDYVDKFCPIFVLGDIINLTYSDYTEMAVSGGVVLIQIEWNCNLDYDIHDCVPKYKFRRLDSTDYKISKGYNFRYAKYFRENGTDYRTLLKAYGVKYIMSVTGQAGKFNLVPLMTNIGSGLALLSIATIICDIAVLYVLKGRHIYKKKKYLEVVGADAYKQIDDDINECDTDSTKTQ